MMQITLPDDGAGWAAMPLTAPQWGRLGVVAKRSFDTAGLPVPTELRLSDEVQSYRDSNNKDRVRIIAEADIALFKSQVDVHLRGIGNQVDGAAVFFNDVQVMGFAGVAANPATDPANLFGYEPRESRIGATTQTVFDFAAMTPALFHSSRKTAGYSQSLPPAPLPQSLRVKATWRVGASEVGNRALTLTLPRLTMTVWLYEGGTDDASYWCAHAQTPLVPDTITLTETGAEVLWRGAVPLDAAPLALVRRIDIERGA